MKAKFLIGVLLVLAITILVILSIGGRFLVFVDVPTYVLLVLVPAAVAFASWPVRDIRRAFSAPFDPGANRRDLEKSKLFFGQLRIWLYSTAGLGTMLGLVGILANMELDSLEHLGRNLGVMLLCVTNAFLFDLLLPLPMAALAGRRRAELE